ncbi:MAG: 4Fe-4S binding protein [Clostridia bacterium]|nr:4Fe-4S binding protein [Clostridia bacterium]
MEGKVYAGPLKNACSPGLNCYSCPGALTSCPIGALQAVIGSARYWYSMYVVGILGVFGLVLGRWICGYLCPFGWFQEWLFKIKSRKCTLPSWTKKIKYVLLVVFVLLLPTLVTNVIGMGDPAYCKYICPVGTLEGGIPLILMNDFLKQALGFLFFWKLGILAMVIIASVLVYRPFCKVLCPLGAIYALFNKVSLYRYHVDIEKCVRCNRCAQVCKMDVVMYKTPNHTECIRCGDCKSICPTSAITSGINIDKAKSL